MKSERKTYYINSGEDDAPSIWDVVYLTEIGLKRRLTKEQCGGVRWAHAYTGDSSFVPAGLIERTLRENSAIKHAGRPKLPTGTRVIDMDRVCIYMRPDEVETINEAARAADMSRQVYLYSKIFG